ncbi:hypothetical protein GCM10010317_043100 [Streptomyces mirabilis]|nr:hypothetical protein GCM10010317_043100 [Streptomyces mirabilis]
MAPSCLSQANLTGAPTRPGGSRRSDQAGGLSRRVLSTREGAARNIDPPVDRLMPTGVRRGGRP